MPFINRNINILDINRFNSEVKAVSTKILSVLKFGDSDLRFEVSSAFTVQEHTDLDAFIATFVDTDPNLKIPLIYDIAKAEAKNKHFHNIDYRIELKQALIPEREKGTVKGEVQEVFWYKDMDVSNPAKPVPINPVLRTNVSYVRDASGFALYRTTTRTYYNRDGSENPDVKTTIKYYHVNTQDMIDEGIKRRSLLVKTIQIPTMNLIAEVLMPLGVTMPNIILRGRKFMDDYEDSFSKFVENSSTITDALSPDFGKKTVIVKLRDETNAGHVEWLDKLPNSLGGSTSIRQFLMDQFNI